MFIKIASSKFYDIALIGLVTLMYVALCAEADIYVPAFPEMINFFGVEDNKIQLILSLNFAGLCIAGLNVGPLSDSFGRRKILLGGLFLFVFSSLGCVLTSDFYLMLFWRLLQGVGASAMMVIGAATFFDKYSIEKAGQIIGVVNSVISASMAGAPIVGAWVTQIFNWRANFIIILILAFLCFLGTLLLIDETLPEQNRRKFQFLSIIKDYIKLSRNFKFMGYTLIVNFAFTAIVVYIANLSIILVNYSGMDLKTFSYYQASTMGTFIIFSLISIKLIAKKGIDFTKNVGGVLATIGSFGLFGISLIDKSNINLICVNMAFIAAGGALMSGTFGIKALSIFPEMKGTSMAMATAVRQLLASVLVILTELFFDGTIVPIATIIFIYACVSLLSYALIEFRSRLPLHANHG